MLTRNKDIAEDLQGNAGSSITTGVWSPVSGDATGSSLVRAMWKRWKNQLGLKRNGRRGEAHDTEWPRVLSLHHELQERRLNADIMARIGNYEIREIPMSPKVSFRSLSSEASPFHQFPQLDALDETLGCVNIEPGRSPMAFQLGALSAIEGLHHAIIDQDLWFEVGSYSPAICYTDSISSLDLNDAGPSWVDEPEGSCVSGSIHSINQGK
ncbi:hypothetical protein N7504_001353 [Penicillium tannophilum]|nr:hypothetical protein N7504_001353 [Penicillium tannophilum]